MATKKQELLSTHFRNIETNIRVEIIKFYCLKNNLSRAKFDLLYPELKCSEKEFSYYEKQAKLHLNGKDLTFEIGYKHFYNLKLSIVKGVFVPQFDTETLVDYVLKNYQSGCGFEIGLGTGAISLAIIKNSEIAMIGIDSNKKAIKLTEQNQKENSLETKEFSFFTSTFPKVNIEGKVDFIISNPPYIDRDDRFLSQWVKQNQPPEALYAKNNGLAFYELIFANYKKWLKPGGEIILEIGFNQKNDLFKIITNNFKKYNFYKDIQGHDRLLVLKT
ncbi:MAG: HemK family protein methyltransferase [Mycoplasmataceae bacterium]|nr:HemK family protein methyltransferase [Mycoplasmataceae bacterium]